MTQVERASSRPAAPRPVAIQLTINGRPVSALVEPRTHLGDFLRDHLRLTGTHLGCEHGVCGACTVLISGAPARACITYAVACDGLEVRTIEGFEDDPDMKELREAFSREHGLQCGFCTPGMLIASRDIVRRLPGADEKRIRIELSGNLCRCTGYLGIVKAVRSVAEKRTAVAPAASPIAQAPVPSTSFVPAEAPARAAASAAPVEESQREGWTRFDESFAVAAPPETVWQALGDFPKMASCLPGAELGEFDARSVKGRLRVKLGPISASFAGSATVERDDAAKSGVIRGAGTDTGSRSRTRGEVRYSLAPEAQGTRVVIIVEYDLQGPLAQFSRSGLAREFGGRIVAEFAANLNAALGAGTAPKTSAASLNVLALLWAAIKRRLGALFVRRDR